MNRNEWLFGPFAAQSVLAVDMIKWQEGCTEAIIKIQDSLDKNAMADYFEFNKKQMHTSIQIVRGELDTL